MGLLRIQVKWIIQLNNWFLILFNNGILFFFCSVSISEAKSESEEDGLDDLHVEEDEELVFKSDHEFSPESDLDEDDLAVQPRKHARTARAGHF